MPIDERLDHGVDRAEEVAPERARGGRGELRPFEVPVCSLNVGAAAAASLGSLVLTHERLDCWAHDRGKGSAKEAAEASGELE